MHGGKLQHAISSDDQHRRVASDAMARLSSFSLVEDRQVFSLVASCLLDDHHLLAVSLKACREHNPCHENHVLKTIHDLQNVDFNNCSHIDCNTCQRYIHLILPLFNSLCFQTDLQMHPVSDVHQYFKRYSENATEWNNIVLSSTN